MGENENERLIPAYLYSGRPMITDGPVSPSGIS